MGRFVCLLLKGTEQGVQVKLPQRPTMAFVVLELHMRQKLEVITSLIAMFCFYIAVHYMQAL